MIDLLMLLALYILFKCIYSWMYFSWNPHLFVFLGEYKIVCSSHMS